MCYLNENDFIIECFILWIKSQNAKEWCVTCFLVASQQTIQLLISCKKVGYVN